MAKLSRLLPLGQRFHSVLSSGTEVSYFTSGTELIVRAPPALARELAFLTLPLTPPKKSNQTLP